MDSESIKPPKKSQLTKANEDIKNLLKILSPGWASLFIDFIFPSIHEKRLDKWRDSVYDSLLELQESKDISFESLRDNIEFITILKQCLFIASRNHQDEKLHFLKNIIVNSIESPLSLDYKLIFNRLVDELTPLHITILKLTIDNSVILKDTDNYENFYNTLINSKIELNMDKSSFFFFVTELINKGLLIVSKDVEAFEFVRESNTIVSGGDNVNLPYIYVSDLGSKFIDYILIEK